LHVTNHTEEKQSICIFGSGATDHIFNNKTNFIEYNVIDTMVYIANWQELSVNGIGSVMLFDRELKENVLLTNVSHVPDIEKNLISLP
jgi:hypothetical protein